MYKAKESFCTKNYDVRRAEILAEDFTNQNEITGFLNIGYIEEYDGSLDITENGTYDVTEYEQVVVNVSSDEPAPIVEANIDLRLFDENEGVYSSENIDYINGLEELYLSTLDEQTGEYTGIFDYVIIDVEGNILHGQIKNADERTGDFYYNNEKIYTILMEEDPEFGDITALIVVSTYTE